MKMKALLISIVILFAAPTFAQTYEVIKMELNCESQAITSGINTDADEFSPFAFDQKIYFTSNRNPSLIADGENNWSKDGQVNLFYASYKGPASAVTKIKTAKLVSERFAMHNHTGPAVFSLTGDTIFMSQVRTGKKGEVYKPQLYYAVNLGNRFTKLSPLPFNDAAFSFAHPSYDSKNKRLYFASDKKGGKGGVDLYYSELTDLGWQTPVPLSKVNTAEDEMYPCVIDDLLFYATNANGKKAGFDIYWKILGDSAPAKPLDGLNSVRDDFGIYIFPDKMRGYYSSNRDGSDDIFYFDMEQIITIRNEMSGSFNYKNLKTVPAGVTVQIVDEADFVLYETTTDKNGNFVFKTIDYDGNYAIKALTEEDLELTLNNVSGTAVTSLLGDESNKFVYRNIASDQSGTLSLIPDDMIDFALNEGHIMGQVIYEDQPNRYPADLQIRLIDENGVETFTSLTDKYGNFEFKKISMAQNYLLTIPESEDNMVLLIYDLKGNVVAQLKTNEQGEFVYRKINPDYSNQLTLLPEETEAFEFETQTIWGYFEYENNKKLTRSDLIVSVYDESGTLISKRLTDQNGAFRFNNLPTEKSLLFKLEENGSNFILDDFTLYIFDRNGQKIAGLKRGQEGYFTYRPLGYDKNSTLSAIEEQNLEFILGEFSATRKSLRVYFDSNETQVKAEDLKILNNLYQVLKNNAAARLEINAYADAKSSDEYNLILSQKRGEWIVAYLTKKGIAANRMIINAYGESQLIDESNDALNRRAEIHLY